MKGCVLLFFVVFSFSVLAQENKKGTITVKKPGAEGIEVLDLIVIENVPSTIAEQMPSYPGGKEMMNAFILKNIKYPEAERKAGITGTVYIHFVVKPDGTVSGVALSKGIKDGPGITAEALRVIKMMPAWTPGIGSGGRGSVPYRLPIKFQL